MIEASYNLAISLSMERSFCFMSLRMKPASYFKSNPSICLRVNRVSYFKSNPAIYLPIERASYFNSNPANSLQI